MPDLVPVFFELKSVMAAYAAKLEVKTDTAAEYYLDTRHIQKNNKPLFFGAVQTKKNYVSFHLMPVYVEPMLLEAISPALKKRMQGKSCFNFVTVDKPLIFELAALTKTGFDYYRKRGFV